MRLNFLKRAAVLSLGLVSLVSCGASYQETDFATFKTKAKDALKSETTYSSSKANVSYKETDNGKSKEETRELEFTVKGREFTAKESSNVYATALAETANMFSLSTLVDSDLSNSTTIKFYTGSGFKVESVQDSSLSILGVSFSQRESYTFEYDNDGFVKNYKQTIERKTSNSSDSASYTSESSVTFSYTK